MWEQIQRTTEGIPATQGTIQSDATELDAYTQELTEVDRKPGMTQAEIHGKIEPQKEEKEMKLTTYVAKDKDGTAHYAVDFMGKTYPVDPGQKQVTIDGVNFALDGEHLTPKQEKAEPEKKTTKKK